MSRVALAEALVEGYTQPEHARRRDNAHKIVAAAIADGSLTREPCEVCGLADPVEAHHDDYDRPLAVRWLCPIHHIEHHVEQGNYPRGLTLREVRQRWGYSIRDVEAKTGIHRGVLSTIERGLRIPTLQELHELSHLYGVPPERWHVVVEYRIRKEVTS